MEIKSKDIGNKKFLYISGEISGIDITKLTNMLEKLTNSRYEQIILDLHKVQFIDSGGIGGLIYIKDHFHRNNKKIALSASSDDMNTLFRDCSFEKIFDIIEPQELKD